MSKLAHLDLDLRTITGFATMLVNLGIEDPPTFDVYMSSNPDIE